MLEEYGLMAVQPTGGAKVAGVGMTWFGIGLERASAFGEGYLFIGLIYPCDDIAG